MHGEHGGAAVYHFCAPVRHHEGDGAAAALINLAELADLPADTGFIENGTDLLQEFRIRIIAAGLAASAAILGEIDAIAKEGSIVLLDRKAHV